MTHNLERTLEKSKKRHCANCGARLHSGKCIFRAGFSLKQNYDCNDKESPQK